MENSTTITRAVRGAWAATAKKDAIPTIAYATVWLPSIPRDVRTVLKIKPTMLPTYSVGVMAPPTVPQPNTTATADTFTRSRTSASRVP